MAHIALGRFQHETNTFAPSLATLADFEAGGPWPELTTSPGFADRVQGTPRCVRLGLVIGAVLELGPRGRGAWAGDPRPTAARAYRRTPGSVPVRAGRGCVRPPQTAPRRSFHAS